MACSTTRVFLQTAATLSANCNCVTDVFVYELQATFPYWKLCFWVPFLKQLLLRNCAVNFVEICKVYVGKMAIKATKRIFNSDKIFRSYSDLNFGVTFWNTVYRRMTMAMHPRMDIEHVQAWMHCHHCILINSSTYFSVTPYDITCIAGWRHLSHGAQSNATIKHDNG